MSANRGLWTVVGGTGLVIAVIVGLWWWNEEKPLPGEAVADIGREHTRDISGIIYNSNPPTSGKHFPIWAKSGVYDRVISDGHLIHSLEHGYIVASYDCTKQNSNVKSQSSNLVGQIYAHDDEGDLDNDEAGPLDASGQIEGKPPLTEMKIGVLGGMSFFTPENAPEKEIDLPSEFSSDECKSLVSKLGEFSKKYKRFIVVPRLNMDTPVAATAWNRILKLDSFDENKIKEFLDAFHNKGPERTVE